MNNIVSTVSITSKQKQARLKKPGKPKFQKKNYSVCWTIASLVHPVRERMALLDKTLELAVDARDQLFAGHEVARVYRLPLCLEEVRLDPVFPELHPVYETALFQFLDDPRALAAVNTQLFPEFALDTPSGRDWISFNPSSSGSAIFVNS